MERSNLVAVLLIVACMAMSATVHGSTYGEGRMDNGKEESYRPDRHHLKRHLISRRCWSAVRKSHTTCLDQIRRSFSELDFIVSDECCDNAMDVETECYRRRIYRQNLLFNLWFKQHCPGLPSPPAGAPAPLAGDNDGELPSPPAGAPAPLPGDDDGELPFQPAPTPLPGDDDGELPFEPAPTPLPGDDDGELPSQPAPAPSVGEDGGSESPAPAPLTEEDGGFESPAPTPTEDDGNDCSD